MHWSAAAEPGTWQITEVQIGELQGSDVEVLSGVKAGERVLGQGAILLKPVVVRCLQPVDSASKGEDVVNRRRRRPTREAASDEPCN